MASQWYYAKSGQQLGPVSSDELKSMASAGRLHPTDMVWKEGMAQWTPASGVKGLFEQASRIPPPLPAARVGVAHGSHTSRSIAQPEPHATANATSADDPLGLFSDSSTTPVPMTRVSFKDAAWTAFWTSAVGMFVCPIITIIGAILGLRALWSMSQYKNYQGWVLALMAVLFVPLTAVTVVILTLLFAR